jgi:hypothetical protein
MNNKKKKKKKKVVLTIKRRREIVGRGGTLHLLREKLVEMFFGCRNPRENQRILTVKVGWREGKALGSEERRAMESGLLCDYEAEERS